jgi:hypothetical protein
MPARSARMMEKLGERTVADLVRLALPKDRDARQMRKSGPLHFRFLLRGLTGVMSASDPAS